MSISSYMMSFGDFCDLELNMNDFGQWSFTVSRGDDELGGGAGFPTIDEAIQAAHDQFGHHARRASDCERGT